MMRKIFAAAGLIALSAAAAHAGTANGNLAVSATITATCTVTDGALAFGSQAASALSSNVDAAGSFGVNCTSNAPYSMTLDDGANVTGTQRRMISGSNYLNYDIYSDSGRTSAWRGTAAVSGTGNGSTQTVNVYGRIPSGQTVPTGAYTDTVQITVSY
jgi:spore coat protein U-like protein